MKGKDLKTSGGSYQDNNHSPWLESQINFCVDGGGVAGSDYTEDKERES